MPEKIYICLIDRNPYVYKNDNYIRIFGKRFVEKNKSKIKILYNGKNMN